MRVVKVLSLVVLSGVLLWIASTSPGLSQWVTELAQRTYPFASTTSEPSRLETTAIGEKPKKRNSTTLRGVPSKIAAVAQPERPEADPELILFLPLVNHTERRLHPTFADGYHAALATHASIYLGHKVVDPGLAVRLADRLGNEPWFGLPNLFEYTDEIVGKAAKRAGAGAVVWGELKPDGSISIDAKAFAEGADVSPWHDLSVAAPIDEPIDSIFWDGPRRLLGALSDARRFNHSAATDLEMNSPDGADRDLQAAMDLFYSGDPANARRAEFALAKLAVRYPSDPAPLVELAFVRSVRPLLFDYEPVSGLMRDGVNVARTLALLHSDLSPAQRARLQLVDHLYVGHTTSDAAFAAYVRSLPANAAERLLLGWLHVDRSREVLGTARAELPGQLGWALTPLARTQGYEARISFATDTAKANLDTRVFESPVMIKFLYSVAEDRGEWGDRRLWSSALFPFAAREALEILRTSCLLLLSQEALASCAEPLISLMTDYAPDLELSPESLANELDWEMALAEIAPYWSSASLPEEPDLALPDKDILGQDPSFAAYWYFTSRVIGATAQAFKSRETSLGAERSPEELLMSRGRVRIHRSLEWMMDASYQGAWRGYSRAQPDEFEPYLELLDPISRQNPYAIWRRWSLYRQLGKQVEKTLNPFHLVSHDPYDPRWIRSARKTTGKDAIYNANWLGVLVPMTDFVMHRVADDWHNGGETNTAYELLRARVESRISDQIAIKLDETMKLLNRPAKERLAVVGRASAAFPTRVELQYAEANLLTELKQFDKATAQFKKVQLSHKHYKSACLGLGRVALMQGDLQKMDRILFECGERAESKWHARILFAKAADLRMDNDDFEGAVEAFQRSRARVGGAGDVLSGLGDAYFYLGDHEASLKNLNSLVSLYDRPGSTGGRRHIAKLALLNGKPAKALEQLKSILTDGEDPSHATLSLLRATYFALGDFNAFREVCERLDTPEAHYQLAIAYWRANRDRETALQLLAKHQEKRPHSEWGPYRAAAIHREAGDLEQANVEIARALELDGDDVAAQRLAAQIWIERGDLPPAIKLAKRHLAEAPRKIFSWELRARVEIAQGKFANARRSIRHAAKKFYPWKAYKSGDYWLAAQELWVLEAALVGKSGSRADDLALAQNLGRATKRTVNYPDVWAALARVRRHLGDAKGAAEADRFAAHLIPSRNGAPSPSPASLAH